MVMRTPIRVVATPATDRAAAAVAGGDVGVALYHIGGPELAGLGASLPQVAAGLPSSPSIRAWDFLSIALAVYAADRFIMRQTAQDSWTRMIALEVELVEPEPWIAQAQVLADTLRFLTSDIWYLRFRNGGSRPPVFKGIRSDRDCISLFSGGLDSLIGAINLVAEGRRPLLVSQASPKEGPVQTDLAKEIGMADHRFVGRVTERGRRPYEPSSRARSVLFVGYGAVAASSADHTANTAELIVPENGFISINAPLTGRHIGSLSTRTSHPHFIASLQKVFDAVDIGVRLHNPYEFKTKGEMLNECKDRMVERLAAISYSCGKGKRLNQHCGRCVPCLIRRASFHAAGLVDGTNYAVEDLSEHGSNVDVASARFAAASLTRRDLTRWAASAGPLPRDAALRASHVGVVARGTEELKAYLATIQWP